MRAVPLLAAAAVFMLGALACTKGDVQKRHHEVVLDGYSKLPIATSLNDKFSGWSFIVHWNVRNDPKYDPEKHIKEWQTQAYLYGRYEVTYVQNVRLNKNGGDVLEAAGQGKLRIFEIKKIFGDPVAPTTDYGDLQITIEGDKLNKLVESGWNFESMGIELKQGEPVENVGWLKNYWNRIYPLQNK